MSTPEKGHPNLIISIRSLSAKRIALLVVGGVIAAWLWVWLFGLWAAYDTPLLKLGLRSGFAASRMGGISIALFASLSAVLFALPLWLSSRRSFLASAAVSILAFFLCFVVPALLERDGISFLVSFTALWLFILFFSLVALLASRIRR